MDKLDCIERVIEQQRTETLPTKVFAKPFRVVFKKSEDQVITWLEVKSLDGLRKVCDMLADGTLVPVDAYSTLDRQLWGHLAEHVGFLRYDGPSGEFSTGIQPAGAGFGDLVADIAALSEGGDALGALAAMRDLIPGYVHPSQKDPSEGSTRVSERQFVKDDDVNLTTKGEEALRGITGENDLDVVADIASQLIQESEPEEGPNSEDQSED